MKSNLKTKFLSCIMALSVIGNLGWNVSASINPNIAQTAEARYEDELNRQLFISVSIGSARAVEADLRRGADVHALDGALQTPLHFIIRRIFEARFLEGSLGVLDALLAHGADPDFRVNAFPGRNLQTPYEYFETHYSNDRNQPLVSAVRQRLNDYRFAPAPQRRRI